MSPQSTIKRISLTVEISSHHNDFESIPKLIEIRDANYMVVESQWSIGYTFNSKPLDPGFYIVVVSLSSGNKKEKVIELKEGPNKPVTINFGGISPRETMEWAYLSKKIDTTASRMKTFTQAVEPTISTDSLSNVRVTKFTCNENKVWSAQPISIPNTFGFEGETVTIPVSLENNILEVTADNVPTIYASLPPSPSLRILIKQSEGPRESVYPIDLTVSTGNWRAESLLSLITNGSIMDAKALANAEIAKDLFEEKFEDPAGAAIGGYFLLKVQDTKRVPQWWMRNFSERFATMADSAIIYASHLLAMSSSKEQVASTSVRELFLDAFERGLPIYTEGLKLLYNGLNVLSCNSTDSDPIDEKIKIAFKKVCKYMEAMDATQETTTLGGIKAETIGIAIEPSKKPVRA